MRKPAFQLFALLTLLPVAYATYRFGPHLAERLRALDPELDTLLAVLGYALTALGGVLVWAVVLLPLRARSGLVPLSKELAAGWSPLYAEAEGTLEARRVSSNPRQRAAHHASVAGAGVLLSLLVLLLAWAAYADEYLGLGLIVVAVVFSLLTAYHGGRALLCWRNRADGDPPGE